MKLTATRLRQIIKEELTRVQKTTTRRGLKESYVDGDRGSEADFARDPYEIGEKLVDYLGVEGAFGLYTDATDPDASASASAMIELSEAIDSMPGFEGAGNAVDMERVMDGMLTKLCAVAVKDFFASKSILVKPFSAKAIAIALAALVKYSKEDNIEEVKSTARAISSLIYHAVPPGRKTRAWNLTVELCRRVGVMVQWAFGNALPSIADDDEGEAPDVDPYEHREDVY